MSARAYPIPHPESGEDPRFCFGLGYDIGKVLEAHGFPPVTGRDHVDLMMALFRFVYASEGRPVPQATEAQLSMMQRAEIHADLKDDRLCDLAARAVHPAVTR